MDNVAEKDQGGKPPCISFFEIEIIGGFDHAHEGSYG